MYLQFVLMKILGTTGDPFREWVESRGLFVLDSEESEVSSETDLAEGLAAEEILAHEDAHV